MKKTAFSLLAGLLLLLQPSGAQTVQDIGDSPLFSRNLPEYHISDFVTEEGWDLHCHHFFQTHKRWLMTFCNTVNGHCEMYLAEAWNPSGEWTIIRDADGKPLEFIKQTEDWEDPVYGIGGLSVVQHYRTDHNYMGWYQYREAGDTTDHGWRTAMCISKDGISWENKTRCNFDKSFTDKFMWGTIGQVVYDFINDEFVGIIHGDTRNTGDKSFNACIGAIVKSADGINWSLYSIIEPMDPTCVEGEMFDGLSLARFDGYWIALGARWNHSESKFIKNTTMAVSKDLKNWEMMMNPFDSPHGQIKYPAIFTALNSIYFSWIDGMPNALGNTIALARIERVANAPIEKRYAELAGGASACLKYYPAGNCDGHLEIKASCKTPVTMEVRVYPVWWDNLRRFSVRAATPCFTKKFRFKPGTDILTTGVIRFPKMFDVELINCSTGAKAEDVSLIICR